MKLRKIAASVLCGCMILSGASCELASHYMEGQGLEFTLSEDGTSYIVTGYHGDSREDTVKIANTYKSLPVTEIAEDAFNSKYGETERIQKIVFERNSPLTVVGANAFAGCEGLREVVIPKNVTQLGDGAFRGCINLKDLAFERGSHLTLVGARAFYECGRLQEVNLPKSVTHVGAYAFAECGNGAISIPDGIVSVGAKILGDTWGWSSTEYEGAYYLGNELNPYLVLLQPKYMYVADHAIREGAKIVSEEAFKDCKDLCEVVIPKSVVTIGRDAFSGCTELDTVFYEGSRAQWEEMRIEQGNGELTETWILYYSEIEPAEKRAYWHYVDGEVVIWQ